LEELMREWETLEFGVCRNPILVWYFFATSISSSIIDERLCPTFPLSSSVGGSYTVRLHEYKSRCSPRSVLYTTKEARVASLNIIAWIL
jgi:hypothetical protein